MVCCAVVCCAFLTRSYWKYPKIPPVDLLKYLEPRYLTQVCDRWSRDKTNIIQLAWFNGDGVETWQNIWGIWQGLTSRDAGALRRLGPLLRFFGRHPRHFLQSSDWIPHTAMLQSESAGVYASAWPVGNETLWSVVNRGSTDAAGPQIAVASSDTRHYYDCYHGVPLRVAGGSVDLEVEAGGFGCVLATPNSTEALSPDTVGLLARMKDLTSGGGAKKLNDLSRNWTALQQTMVPIPPTPPWPHDAEAAAAPPGMVMIPAVENFTFVATGVEIEGPRGTPSISQGDTHGSGGSMGVSDDFVVQPWPPLALSDQLAAGFSRCCCCRWMCSSLGRVSPPLTTSTSCPSLSSTSTGRR